MGEAMNVADIAKFGLARKYGDTLRQVEQFASGGTDDTTQIVNAFAWLVAAPGRALWFQPRKTYTVSATCYLTGAAFFTLFGNGATIKAADGLPVVDGKQMVQFENATDGDIFSLNVDGNRANRTPAAAYAYSIIVNTNTARLRFHNCTAHNAVIDGFYVQSDTPTVLASLPTDIAFINCSANNAFRNNLSIINSNRFRDYNGIYNGANGTAPQSGIDVEPNATTEQGNIDCRFYGTTTNNNAGVGLTVELSNSFVKCFEIVSSGNTQGAIGGGWGGLEINGITLEHYTSSVVRGLIDCSVGAGPAIINDVTANDCLTGSDSKSLIYVHGASIGPISAHRVTQRASDCAMLNADGRVFADTLESIGQLRTGSHLLLLNGPNNAVRNLRAKGIPGYVGYVGGANCTVDGVRIEDPSMTGDSLLQFDTGATAAVLNDFEVYQTSAIPSGQIGVSFNVAPARVTNVVGRSDGTAYTAAQLLVFNGGSAGAILHGISPFAGVGYTVANLPTTGPLVYDGAQLWCTNGRNSGESAGAGTGCTVVYATGKGWRIPGVSTAVSA